MTEKNTSMMRELFVLISRHEQVPEGYDESYWNSLTAGAAEIYGKYPSPLTAQLLIGTIDGFSETYKAMRKAALEDELKTGEQLEMDLTGGAAS